MFFKNQQEKFQKFTNLSGEMNMSMIQLYIVMYSQLLLPDMLKSNLHLTAATSFSAKSFLYHWKMRDTAISLQATLILTSCSQKLRAAASRAKSRFLAL